eukprot:COSAG01_NODE_4581_length_4903_cov_12.766445_4_plen_133_part_00
MLSPSISEILGVTPAFGWRGRRARVRVAVVVLQCLAAGALRPEPCAFQQLRAALPPVLLRGSCSALILACLLLAPPLPPLLGAVAEYHPDICARALSKCGLHTAAQQHSSTAGTPSHHYHPQHTDADGLCDR